MADEPENELKSIAEEAQQRIMQEIENYPLDIVAKVYQLWWHWADFELYIVSPIIEPIIPCLVIPPEPIPNASEGGPYYEPVYNIHDYGCRLITSKGEEMYTVGMSMFKLYNTIEKMIFLLIERLKSGGIDKETETQVAFGGHELARRKAFESIINLVDYNVVVTNFDPGLWGEHFLRVVKNVAEKGYGYPPEAPRDKYKNPLGSTPKMRR